MECFAVNEKARDVLARAIRVQLAPPEEADEAYDVLAEEMAKEFLAALADAGLAVEPIEEKISKAGVCHACQRAVDRVRGTPWHGPYRICLECFYQWYDPDVGDVDPTSSLSVGNATRRKLGLPLLTAATKP